MNAKGFTLIETMIVIAIMAALVSVGLPAYRRSMAQAKLFDAVSMLSAAASQVQGHCAAYSAFDGAAVVAQTPAPNGFGVPVVAGGGCGGFILQVCPAESALPAVCVQGTDRALMFDAAGGEYGRDDLPVGARSVSRLGKSFCGACSS